MLFINQSRQHISQKRKSLHNFSSGQSQHVLRPVKGISETNHNKSTMKIKEIVEMKRNKTFSCSWGSGFKKEIEQSSKVTVKVRYNQLGKSEREMRSRRRFGAATCMVRFCLI